MTRRDIVQAFLIGTLALPVFGIIFGYEWWIILLSAVVGGPLMIGVAVRNSNFRDVLRPRRSDESAYVSRATLRLGMMAIVALVSTVVIVALIVNR